MPSVLSHNLVCRMMRKSAVGRQMHARRSQLGMDHTRKSRNALAQAMCQVQSQLQVTVCEQLPLQPALSTSQGSCGHCKG